MSNLKLAGTLCAVAGAVCLLLVQFLPWGGIETEGGSAFGFSFPGAEVTSYTWRLEANGEKADWYDDDLDGSDGVGTLRTAIPFLLAGLAVTAVGILLSFGRGVAGTVVTLAGGVIAIVGLVLFATGTNTFYDDQQDWAASFYLAIAGVSLACIGGVLGLVSANRASGTTF